MTTSKYRKQPTTTSQPINIEGDYEEIIKYLDENEVNKGVAHVGSHSGILNVGLFSIVEANTGKGRWTMCFDRLRVDGWGMKAYMLDLYEGLHSHKIRF